MLVANRIDLCDDEALARFDALAAELWPGPLAVHHTTYGRLPAAALEWPPGEGARIPRAAPRASYAGASCARLVRRLAADSSAGFAARSFRWSPELVFSRERLERAALRASQALAGAPLARFKGIFRTQEGFLKIEVAGGTLHAERSLHRRDSCADAIFENGDAAAAAAMQKPPASASPAGSRARC